MNNPQAQKVMGISGVVMGLMVLLTVPLYFIYSGPPPAWNVLTRDLLALVMLVPAGYAVLQTRILPSWLGWSAYIVAVCNLAFVPSLYFGADVTSFYSAIGWGNFALVGGLLGYWILAVGVVSLRRK